MPVDNLPRSPGSYSMNARILLLLGSLLAGIGVAAGAFGAHGLSGRLSPAALATYEKGVHYQLFHALALIAVGLLALQHPSWAIQLAGWAFLIGIGLFSGGLYAWVLSGFRPLVHIVPIGGVSFLVGWTALAIAAWLAGGNKGIR